MTEAERSAEREPLARHMLVAPTRDRIERQWAVVSGRIAGRPLVRGWSRTAGIFAVAAALAIAFFVGRRFAPATTAGASELSIACETAGQLADLPGVGSLECVERGRYSIAWSAQRARVELESGAVTFDVPPGAGRAWSVGAGAFEVRVIGTRFTVRRDPSGRGSVSVERGHVEVVPQAGAPKSLQAGESWESAPLAIGAEPPASAAATSSATAAAAPSGEASAEPAQPSAPEPARPTWDELARAKKPKEAWEALGSDGFARAVESASPEKLFRLAEVARAAGHMKEAARAFDVLRRQHRGDARAAIAAFELGRMRQDAFGDAAGAAEALGDALALSPNAPFREDAEARRVAALDASGARGACRAAREAYLSRWPSGAHAAMVRARCAP